MTNKTCSGPLLLEFRRRERRPLVSLNEDGSKPEASLSLPRLQTRAIPNSSLEPQGTRFVWDYRELSETTS